MVIGTTFSSELYPNFGNGFTYNPLTRITTLIAVPGSTFSVVNCINSAGTVTGSATSGYVDNQLTPTYGYIRTSAGTLTAFTGIPNGSYTSSLGINDSGVVTGYGFDENYGNLQCFIRAADGTITLFSVPGTNAPEETFATSINNEGVVTGYYQSQESGQQLGFIRAPNGHISTFGFPGQPMTAVSPTKITNSDDIIGTTGLNGYAFLRTP